MTNATDNYLPLAEADGAMFTASGTGTWSAKDRHGVTIVRGAESRAEAARLYCEDQDLTPSTAEAILARIVAQYRPYDTMDAFGEGFTAYQKDGAFRRNPYDGQTGLQAGVNAQAWDRGANAAMLYQRAMAHLNAHREDVEKAGPGWLVRFLRNGRC